MNSHGRSSGNSIRFVHYRWISTSFCWPLLGFQKGIEKHSKYTPKWTNTDAQVDLETRSKNILKNELCLDSEPDLCWVYFIPKRKKEGTVQEEGGVCFTYVDCSTIFGIAYRFLKNYFFISVLLSSFLLLETFVFAARSMRNACFTIRVLPPLTIFVNTFGIIVGSFSDPRNTRFCNTLQAICKFQHIK